MPPASAALLDEWETFDEFGDVVPIDIPRDMTASCSSSSLPVSTSTRRTSRPTFEELDSMAERCPSISFQGYRVTPDRDDERITLEGLGVPSEDVTDAMRAFVARLGPDEMDDDGDYWYVWWN